MNQRFPIIPIKLTFIEMKDESKIPNHPYKTYIYRNERQIRDLQSPLQIYIYRDERR